LFGGYEDEGGVLVGTAEKALLDLLDIRGVRTVRFLKIWIQKGHKINDYGLTYAKRFGKGTKALAVELGLITA